MRYRRSRIGGDLRRLRLGHVLHKREVFAALVHARGAAEVVNRDAVDAFLREPERQLFVEAEQPAYVRQHDDPWTCGFAGAGEEGSELCPIGGLKDEVLGVNSRPRNGHDCG